MARKLLIKPSGIVRNTADPADGDCLEVINMRYKDEAWRSVGLKTTIDSYSSNKTLRDWYYHPASEMWVCFNETDWKIQYIDLSAQSPALVDLVTLANTEEFRSMASLKNVLYVYTNSNSYAFFWKSGYTAINKLPIPIFQATDTEQTTITGQVDVGNYESRIDGVKGCIGQALKEISDAGKENKFTGNVLIRLAWRLFDGSYVFHSTPYYWNVGYHAYTTDFCGVLMGNDYFVMQEYVVAKLKLWYHFKASQVAIIDSLKQSGLIQSLDVFMTRPLPSFNINGNPEDWTTDTGVPTTAGEWYAPVSDGFTQLVDYGQYYLIHSFTPDSIHSTPVGSVIPDLTDLSSITTNTLLPNDDFTNHTLIPNTTFLYNSRLHLADITVKLSAIGDNFIYSDWWKPGTDTYEATMSAGVWEKISSSGLYQPEDIGYRIGIRLYQAAYLNTDEGEKVVVTEIEPTRRITGSSNYDFQMYTHSGDMRIYLKPFAGYPDYRCFRIDYYMYDPSTEENYLISSVDMHSVTSQNLAVAQTPHSEFDDTDSLTYLAIPADVTGSSDIDIPESVDTINDSNRIQASQINNPLYFPTENSYRVGNPTDTVKALEVAMSAMSDTAFGRYPLYVFSDAGVYVLSQGEGKVLYSSVQPINSLKIISDKAKININGAIFFATKEGVFALIGSQALEISTSVEGSPVNSLYSKRQFIQSLTEDKLPLMYNYLTDVEFKTFLSNGVIFGYDSENNEITISSLGYYTPAYNYSYVYSITNKVWHTVTQSYSQFLVKDSRWLGVQLSEATGVFTTSLKYMDEETTTLTNEFAYIQTRPLKLQGDGLKRLEATLARLNKTETDNFSVYQVWGSNDKRNWSLINYIQTTRPGEIYTRRKVYAMKYFMFVLAFDRSDAVFDGISMVIEDRLLNRTSKYGL